MEPEEIDSVGIEVVTSLAQVAQTIMDQHDYDLALAFIRRLDELAADSVFTDRLKEMVKDW